MLYIKNGIIRERSRIVLIKDGFQTINPTEEMVLSYGADAKGDASNKY